ncbi:amino acid ABC transporter permease [Mesorhizobium delmotii]|uniref:amino acid ABC transporter permease n=1 Tax=Mesorhizobium delmotii TaxID=1631247 RepID=UPI001FCE3F28|nr:ABC transporter permease subunit [Mesorhizobium delmotii]
MSGAARFPIAESLIAYDPTSSYLRAFTVGLINTLHVSILTIVIATILGAVIGMGRRSANPVVANMAGVYVEVFRNTPLVVQLLFWYGLLTLAMPASRAALEPVPGVFLSLRGLFFPWPVWNETIALLLMIGVAGIAASISIAAISRRDGRLLKRRSLIHKTILAMSAVGIAAAIATGTVRFDWPALSGFNFEGGATLTPEFTALMVGLVLYTAAFVAEIVRGAIAAVPKGQWEAGWAVGLRERQILRLVVLPQALRLMVPPMTSQYLNVVKNTTLALAVGYPDFAAVVATTINQTNQAIEGVAILMAVYLSISLSISLFMNWYNASVALVQR